MTLGQKIKQIRLLRGLTQEDLAEKAGLERRNGSIRISQYESDKRIPNNDVIEMLSNALDVSPFVFLSADFSENSKLIHYLYNLESNFNITVSKCDSGISIHFPDRLETDIIKLSETYTKDELIDRIAELPLLSNIYGNLYRELEKWCEKKEEKNSNNLTREEYEEWKLKFPK